MAKGARFFRCKSKIIILKCLKIVTLNVLILCFKNKFVLNGFCLYLHLKIDLFFTRDPQKFAFIHKSHKNIKNLKTIYVHQYRAHIC